MERRKAGKVRKKQKDERTILLLQMRREGSAYCKELPDREKREGRVTPVSVSLTNSRV